MRTNANPILSSPSDSGKPVVRAYFRVSTDTQDAERQKQNLEALAQRDYPERQIVWYAEHGVSAFSVPIWERPASKQMLADLQEGDVILADDQDRLSRGDEAEHAGLKAFVQAQGAQICTASNGILTDELGSRVTWALKGILAHEESVIRGRRIATAHAARAAAGLYSHGDVTPGYKFCKETKQLLATTDLAIITEIFRRFAEQGESYASLCRFATENINEGALVRRQGGKREVTRHRLRSWLRNPIFLGQIVHKGELFKGSHEAAVDQLTWQRTQSRLDKLAEDNSRREAKNWPFQGFIRCPGGNSIRPHRVPRRNGTVAFYTRCSKPACQKIHKSFDLAPTESNVVLHLAAVALSVEKLLLTDEKWAIPKETAPTLEEIQERKIKAEKETARLARLSAYAADDEEITDLLETAVKERDRLSQEAARLQGSARTYREELFELVSTVLALADLAPEDPEAEFLAEESITYVGRTTETTYTVQRSDKQAQSLLQVLRGWNLADFATKRAILARALDTAVVGPTLTFNFRAELPPIELAVEHGPSRSEEFQEKARNHDDQRLYPSRKKATEVLAQAEHVLLNLPFG